MKVLFLVALLPIISVAQPVPGTPYNFPIAAPAFDLTGHQSGGDDYVDLDADVTHLANGRLTGIATAEYSGSEYDLTATGPLYGKVSGGTRRVATFSFKAPIAGEDIWGNPLTGGYQLKGSAVHNGFFTFDGEAKSRACVRGEGCVSGAGYLYLEPTGSNWTLGFTNLQVAGGSVTGEAIARMTDNGRTFNYSVRGKFNFKSGVTTLKLKGVGSGAGSSLVFRAGNGFELQRLTGKLLGQTITLLP